MHEEIVDVDVCLASYNGERYIEKQLSSIIKQTRVAKRIIVTDDASSDSTVFIVKDGFGGGVEVFESDKNLGHVRNFERAISESSSEIIILSDQDDFWDPEKVKKVVKIFNEYPSVVMVHHNLTTVDVSDRELASNYIRMPSGLQGNLMFILREFFRPRVFGCAMAFRRSVLDVLLPFPKYVYAHDHWIAVASAFVGKIYFLDESLGSYRQHENNLTPKSRRPIGKILRSRMGFLRLIICAFARQHLCIK